MKKILFCFIAVILSAIAPIQSFALSFTEEPFSEIPLVDLGRAYLTTINSENYIMLNGVLDVTMKYDETEYKHLIDDTQTATAYIWTGNYYFTRDAGADGARSDYEWSSPQMFRPVRLYDKEFNLIKEYKFDGYVRDISYYNGTYYCYLAPRAARENLPSLHDRFMASTDFENWTEISGPLPKNNADITYKIEKKLSISAEKTTQK